MLCLSLWARHLAGHLAGRADPSDAAPKTPTWLPRRARAVKVRLRSSCRRSRAESRRSGARLRRRPAAFGPSLWAVGGLMFAVSGYTMWLSACGRFRWRVLGLAVFLTLVQFLVNLVGQMWDVLEPLRPLTIFYYYQPQQVILGASWSAVLPSLAVLYGVGAAGYAWRCGCSRGGTCRRRCKRNDRSDRSDRIQAIRRSSFIIRYCYFSRPPRCCGSRPGCRGSGAGSARALALFRLAAAGRALVELGVVVDHDAVVLDGDDGVGSTFLSPSYLAAVKSMS